MGGDWPLRNLRGRKGGNEKGAVYLRNFGEKGLRGRLGPREPFGFTGGIFPGMGGQTPVSYREVY